MYRACSLARNTTIAEHSSTVPCRGIGTPAIAESDSPPDSCPGVRSTAMLPGPMQLAVMLYFPYSVAIARVNPSFASFSVPWPEAPRKGAIPE